MKQLTAIILLSFLATSAQAQENTAVLAPPVPVLETFAASDVVLDDFVWRKRVVVVFADTDQNPAFQLQIELLNARPSDLIARDVVIVTDTNPAEPTEIRLELRPRGFAFVLIDKDGAIKLRKPSPWSSREIAHSIDKTTSRIEEVKGR